MWTREQLKTRAKGVLRVSYWKALLVSVILFFVGAAGDYNYSSSSNNVNYRFNSRFNYNRDLSLDLSDYFPILAISGIVILIVIILVILFSVFISNPLQVGGKKYFLKSTEMNFDMNNLGYAFKKDRYSNIVKTMFIKDLFLFFWYLLLVIPGIVKSYAYRMVPYILCDNPNMDYNKAIALSNEMTHGHKFDIFVLDLSFIGWHILSGLIPFAGNFFVMPYTSATDAELYLALKDIAIANGLCNPNELPDYEY